MTDTPLRFRRSHFILRLSTIFMLLAYDLSFGSTEQQRAPKIVVSEAQQAPSDAIILFAGKQLKEWESVAGGAAPWPVKAGYFTVKPGSGDIKTKRHFCDIQLHLEWRAPAQTAGLSGQNRGNSGIFFQDRYEVQILDSYQNTTYTNGQAAAVYKQHIPLVNATRPPNQWNVYDIIFKAPRFAENGELKKAATITMLHNGVLVHNNVALLGPTEWQGQPEYKKHHCAPLRLQDHNNSVSFRNIWLREINL